MARSITQLSDKSDADLKALKDEICDQLNLTKWSKWYELSQTLELVQDEINLRIDSIGT